MKINELHIDAYCEAIGRHIVLPNSPFAMIYGPNEAGKSTLLSFLRVMLFGSDLGKGNKYEILRSRTAHTGGSLNFQFQDGRTARLDRKWSNAEKGTDIFACELNELNGKITQLTDEEFRACLSNINCDFFSNFFGFSYAELAINGQTMKRQDLAQLVYGMSFGGADQLEKIRKELTDRCDALFKASAKSTRFINTTIAQMNDYVAKLKEVDSPGQEYQSRLNELQNFQKVGEELTAERANLERQLRFWTDAFKAFPRFHDYYLVTRRLQIFNQQSDQRFVVVFPLFSEQDEAQLEFNRNQRRNLQGQFDESHLKLTKLTHDMQRLEEKLDPLFCSLYEQIEALASDVSAILLMQKEAPEEHRALAELQRALNARMVELGALDSIDAHSEQIDAAKLLVRRAIVTTDLEEIKRAAQLEQNEEDKLKIAVDNKRQSEEDLQAKTAQLQSVQRQREEQFGEWTELVNLQALVDVEKVFAAYETQAKSLENERRQMDTARDLEDAEARNLLAQAYGSTDLDVQDAVEQLQDLTEPLQSQLQSLSEEYNNSIARQNQAKHDLAQIHPKVRELKQRAKSNPTDQLTSIKDIREARRARDLNWTRVWESLKVRPQDYSDYERDAYARIFEESIRTADELVDAFAQEAKQRADALNARAQWHDAVREAKKYRKAIATEHARQQELNRHARWLWNCAGLNGSAGLNAASALDWLGKWRVWFTARQQRLSQFRALQSQASQLAQKLANAMEIAAAILSVDRNYTTAQRDAYEHMAVALRRQGAELLLTQGIVESTNSVRIVLDQAVKTAGQYKTLDDEIAKLQAACDAARAKCEQADKRIEDAQSEITQLREHVNALAQERELALPFAQPHSCDHWLRLLAERKACAEKWDEFESKIQDVRTKQLRLQEFVQSVASLALRLEVGFDRENPCGTVKRWYERAKLAKDAKEEFERLAKDRDEQTETQNKLRQSLDEAHSAITQIIERLDITEDDLEAFLEYVKRRRELEFAHKQARTVYETLVNPLTDERYERITQTLRSCEDQGAISDNIQRCEERQSEIQQRIDENNQRVKELQALIRASETQEKYRDYIQDYDQARTALAQGVEDYLVSRFALHALNASVDEFEREKIPAVLEYAQELFERITEGRYLKISTRASKSSGRSTKNEDERIFYVVDHNGLEKLPTELSTGTREQLYLALRLAHIKLYCEEFEPLPVFADDILVNCDNRRSQKILECLQEYATDQRQFVLFTCRQETRRAMASFVGQDAIVDLDMLNRS
ncbi:MAG: AAA family ATPase [Planctomycetia bacterium]|nr:AAA family ATPase [Planctomycetia bacterium]